MAQIKWIALGCMAAVICLLLGGCIFGGDRWEQETVAYCSEINDLIKEHDFFTAKITANGIALYDRNFCEQETVPFDGYRWEIWILGIEKSDEMILFVLSGDVDDRQGLMFVNDETADINGVMNGIHSLERAGGSGNCYYYDTRK